MTIELETTVSADFSQFYLFNVGSIDPNAHGKFLALHQDDSVMLTAARQFGDLPVSVTLFEGRPNELGPEWENIAEVSIIATDSSSVGGWMPEPEDLELGLDDGVEYRLRYALSGATEASITQSDEVTELYRIDLWPEPVSAEAPVRRDAKFGFYWHMSQTTSAVRDEIYARSVPLEQARIEEFADRAFTLFPELVADLKTDEPTYLSGLSSTALMLLGEGIPSDLPMSEAASIAEHRRALLQDELQRLGRQR